MALLLAALVSSPANTCMIPRDTRPTLEDCETACGANTDLAVTHGLDLHKRIRRTDKETAALVGVWRGEMRQVRYPPRRPSSRPFPSHPLASLRCRQRFVATASGVVHAVLATWEVHADESAGLAMSASRSPQTVRAHIARPPLSACARCASDTPGRHAQQLSPRHAVGAGGAAHRGSRQRRRGARPIRRPSRRGAHACHSLLARWRYAAVCPRARCKG